MWLSQRWKRTRRVRRRPDRRMKYQSPTSPRPPPTGLARPETYTEEDISGASGGVHPRPLRVVEQHDLRDEKEGEGRKEHHGVPHLLLVPRRLLPEVHDDDAQAV